MKKLKFFSLENFGILFLLALAGVLLLTRVQAEGQRFAGWIALLWALAKVLISFFRDKTGKSEEEIARDFKKNPE